jgi:hypothetical protein
MAAPTGLKLYYTIEQVKNTFSKIAYSSYFKTSFPLSNKGVAGGLVDWLTAAGIYDANDNFPGLDAIELLCSNTILPGPNFKTTDTIGNRQGVIEKYPILRQFPELTMTFYVDSNHKVIRFFEEWFNYVNPLYSKSLVTSSPEGQSYREAGSSNSYYRFNYPKKYCQTIQITKFEKDLTNTYQSSYLTYEFVQAYPSNIIVAPVSYQASEILNFTVTFNYIRYFTRNSLPKGNPKVITVADTQVSNFLNIG